MTWNAHSQRKAPAGKSERIDLSYDYAVCAWARHFNVSEKRVKEAVAAVGDDSEKVRAHLAASTHRQERPAS